MPTRIVSPIALTTADAAFGCSERNASTMNTNGRRHSPNAISGPAAGVAFASSTPSETSAATHRPVGGHEQERRERDRAPLTLRRQRLDARRRRSVARASPSAQPFTEPAVSPRTKYFWSEKNTTSGSAIEMNAAAVSSCHVLAARPVQTRPARA